MNPLEKLLGSSVLTIVLMMTLGILTLNSTLFFREEIGQLWRDGTLMNIYQTLYGVMTLGIALYLWHHKPERTEYVLIPTVAIAGLVAMNEYHMPFGLLIPTMILYLGGVVYWILSERGTSS